MKKTMIQGKVGRRIDVENFDDQLVFLELGSSCDSTFREGMKGSFSSSGSFCIWTYNFGKKNGRV
jgi:hypothetical protein